jgi:GTP diphosphokinase / guanosine-3',5'-bis(diphosphate) 3'-diphosphatase
VEGLSELKNILPGISSMYLIDTEQEKKEILKQYRNLLSVWKTKPDKDRQLVRKAFNLAVEAHKDMRRKSGEPYIYHPIEVARLCVEEIGLGTTSIICALLHDVVEDTDYSIADIEALFGEKVARIINGLTKMTGFVDQQTGSLQAENFRRILITLADDIRVILVKLADRLHNMRTLDFMPREKQLKIASETAYLYAPLAHRLGLYSMKTELADLALKYTEPELYHAIAEKINAGEKERKRFIQKFISPIKKSLAEEGVKYVIVPRIKSVYSVWEKMDQKEVPFEEIFDIFSIGIIIDSKPEKEKMDCWKVYSMLTDHYKPNMDRLRDWISIPKANGYEAIHTTVMSHDGKWVDIQIRSKRMDEIANKGYAAHWKYRDPGNVHSGPEEWLAKARELLDEELDTNALEFVDDFKLNLYSDEIYVFTPKGAHISLPAGSTVLDFAFNIHTQIGNNSIGAKVNYRLAPLDQVLKSGDQVEIITSSKQKPKPEWLNFVITAKARAKIKEGLREGKKAQVSIGKETLEALFQEAQLEFSKVNLQKLLEYFELPNQGEFFLKVGSGGIKSEEIKSILKSQEKEGVFNFLLRPFLRLRATGDGNFDDKLMKKIRENPGVLLLKEDINQIKYSIAECCHPIPGDDVIGLIQKDEIIQIHRTNCPTAIEFMSRFGDKIVKAKWKAREDVGFLCGIKLNTVDKKGIINNIAKVISEQHFLNIRSFHMETSGGLSKGIIMLYVQDTKNLDELVSSLKQINGILNVTRINHIEMKNPLA